MTKFNGERTYEGEVLSVLAFEFSVKDHAESERKLRRHLREKNLGPYDERRITSIREFKDDLQVELGRRNKSEFYIESKGKYAGLSDWDINSLLSHMKKSTRKFRNLQSNRSFHMQFIFTTCGERLG